jgi:hypothetical protein
VAGKLSVPIVYRTSLVLIQRQTLPLLRVGVPLLDCGGDVGPVFRGHLVVRLPDVLAGQDPASGRTTSSASGSRPRSTGPAGGATSGFGSCSAPGSGGRFYRPKCKRRPKAGQPDCGCRQIDVAKLDAAVWTEVVGVLGDRERLLKLAAEGTRSGTTSEAHSQEAERPGEQARKLTRAIQRATDEAFMADGPEELLMRVARYRAQLGDVRAKLDALQSTGLEARGNARQLTELAALADRAAERLRQFGDAERLELVELLDLRVDVAGPLVAGLPESVTVRGVLDPRAQ